MKITVQPEAAAVLTAPTNGHDAERTAMQRFRLELDAYYDDILQYSGMEPDQVLISISGISARLLGIRADLQRSGTARATKFRTSEVDPLLEHLEMQFRIHSRLLSARELDFKMAGGQPC